MRESIVLISRNRKSESSHFRNSDRDNNCFRLKMDVCCYRISNWGRHVFGGRNGRQGGLSFLEGFSRWFRHRRLRAIYISWVQRYMFLWCRRALIWIFQVNVWGFVDSNESSIEVFKGVDKSGVVQKRCWGRVIGSGLKHGRYLLFDRLEEWRWRWGVWHSGNDIKFFKSGRC